MNAIDYAAFQLINGFAGHAGWLDRAMVLVADYGSVLFVAALLWLWARPSLGRGASPDRLAVGRALAAAALALTLGQILTRVFPRPRPFLAHTVRLLIRPSPDPSFPSDHALAAFSIAAAVISTHRWLGVSLFVLSALLGVARIFAGAHYPFDVMAGVAMGGTIGTLIHRADAWIAPLVRLGARWTDAVFRQDGEMRDRGHKPPAV